MKTIAIISVLLYLCCTVSSFWWPCDGGLRAPDRVESPHCDAVRCHAVRGQNLTARVYITSFDNHHELRVSATVFILGVGVNVPTQPPHDNGCNSLFIGDVQQSCPTQANRQYTWVVHEEIPTTLITFNNARLMYQIHDRGTLVGCVNLNATLV